MKYDLNPKREIHIAWLKCFDDGDTITFLRDNLTENSVELLQLKSLFNAEIPDCYDVYIRTDFKNIDSINGLIERGDYLKREDFDLALKNATIEEIASIFEIQPMDLIKQKLDSERRKPTSIGKKIEELTELHNKLYGYIENPKSLRYSNLYFNEYKPIRNQILYLIRLLRLQVENHKRNKTPYRIGEISLKQFEFWENLQFPIGFFEFGDIVEIRQYRRRFPHTKYLEAFVKKVKNFGFSAKKDEIISVNFARIGNNGKFDYEREFDFYVNPIANMKKRRNPKYMDIAWKINLKELADPNIDKEVKEENWIKKGKGVDSNTILNDLPIIVEKQKGRRVLYEIESASPIAVQNADGVNRFNEMFQNVKSMKSIASLNYELFKKGDKIIFGLYGLSDFEEKGSPEYLYNVIEVSDIKDIEELKKKIKEYNQYFKKFASEKGNQIYKDIPFMPRNDSILGESADRQRFDKKANTNLEGLIKEIESWIILLKNSGNERFNHYPLKYNRQTKRINVEKTHEDFSNGQIEEMYWCKKCSKIVGDVWNHAEEHLLNTSKIYIDKITDMDSLIGELEHKFGLVDNPEQFTENKVDIINFILSKQISDKDKESFIRALLDRAFKKMNLGLSHNKIWESSLCDYLFDKKDWLPKSITFRHSLFLDYWVSQVYFHNSVGYDTLYNILFEKRSQFYSISHFETFLNYLSMKIKEENEFKEIYISTFVGFYLDLTHTYTSFSDTEEEEDLKGDLETKFKFIVNTDSELRRIIRESANYKNMNQKIRYLIKNK